MIVHHADSNLEDDLRHPHLRAFIRGCKIYMGHVSQAECVEHHGLLQERPHRSPEELRTRVEAQHGNAEEAAEPLCNRRGVVLAPILKQGRKSPWAVHSVLADQHPHCEESKHATREFVEVSF